MSLPLKSVNVNKRPGPQGRWMAAAARDLNVSLSHLWQVVTKKRESRALESRIADWKARNL